MLKKYQQQTLAIQLLNLHAKVKIVHQETGIPIKLLRQTYRQLHGQSPSRGSIKFSTRGLTGNHRKYKDATIFAVCFQVASTKSTEGQIQTLITAFDAYKKSYPSGQLKFSDAWVVAQDIKDKKIQLSKCPQCRSWVLLKAREDLSERCSVCRIHL
ncbi:FlhC family transcriptional regulator [Methylomonas koyamae]|uniref:FlhC family transcriptional regulator n=1 Tax=Methylomonas koyamae TaxID=702114 RepID=UPI0028735817|nr:FlhC family transcriptional regulator [Methylomonas koyamae]WNB74115.1 FlhC family transcriptional regulator [Methylomonas koyamae]